MEQRHFKYKKKNYLKVAEIARISCEKVTFQKRKSSTKFHFKVRKPHFKLRKPLFKRGLEINSKTNVLEFDVEKIGLKQIILES